MNNQKQKDDNNPTASGSNNDSDNRIDAAAETTACSSNTSSTSSSSSTNTRSTNSTTSSSSNKALEAPSTSTSTTQSADRPTASIAQSSNNNSRPGSSSRSRSSSQQNQNRREVKRSTIKQLIESYFFQLQRGCGNPRCQNAYCASSGQVKQMTPNEAAAMALQLFSQDAQLCNSSDIHEENNTRGRHRRTGEQSHPADMHSPDSNSSHSTITLGSSADSTTSSTATSPSKSTTSLSEPQHLIPVLLNHPTASSSSSFVYDSNGGAAAASTSSAAAKNNCSATTAAVLAASASDDANINGPPTPTHNAFPYLDVAIGIDLIEWCKRTQEFERLWQALDDVFSNVQRLNASFRLPKRRTLALQKKLEYAEDDVAATSTSRYFTEIFGDISEAVAFADAVAEANAVKKLTNADADSVDENVGNGVKELKSPEMSKEAQRALEGEIDKDEDSTQPETEGAGGTSSVGAIAIETTQNSNLTDTDIDSMSAQGPSTCYSSSGASSADPTDDADLRNPFSNLATGLPTILDEENGVANIAADIAHDINADLDTDASTSRPANRFSPSRDLNAAESLPENSNPDRQQQESSLSSTLFSRYFIDEPQWRGVNTEVDELFDWEFTSNSNIDIDFDGLRTFKQKLMDLQIPEYFEVMNMAMVQLCCSCSGYEVAKDWEKVMRCVVICFDIVTTSWMDMEFIDRAMPALCRVAAQLPVSTQARLTRVWSVHGKDRLRSLVDTCQQLITLKVITEETDVQENPVVIAATKVLRIVYYASIMAGELDKPIPDHDNLCECGEPSTSGARAAHDLSLEEVLGINIPRHENRLEAMLGISAMDSRKPYVPFEEFYNEPLSDSIHMDKDYLAYKNLLMDPQRESQDLHFSFMCYSFILNPACKVIALYYDSRIRMYSERNSSLYSLLSLHSSDGDVRPDLRLKVRRDKLIHDALSGLEVVAMSNPKDLKKQLVVEFVGEQGIDEGGVSKEFFQLVIEEIFNPDIGMFVANEDSNTMWFNGAALESDSQFTLIGIILGLAIYNNIILAVNFPKVVYRKLMNGRGTYHDLRDFSPTLYRSMKQLLQYDQDDVEDVFMLTFKVSYVTVFGETLEYELKPGGGEMLVTKANKHEFVALYADFLLNKLVEKQFRAFKKGFDMVTDESPLKLLFRPEEIELLVCGSRKFDFKELEKSTEYEGGYTKESQTIKDFWIVVHAMSNELKRKLLEFTTGSDRVPVGGFSRLKLLITRNGPDSDRLPTSHTCFNVLLLPEYSTKDKLEERLLKAINYSKGFGML